MVLVGVNKLIKKHQYTVFRMVSSLFNKELTLDHRPQPKKPWYKLW